MCVYVLSPWHWLSWIKKPCGHVGTQRPSYRLDGEGQDVQLSADGPAHCQQEGWHSEEDTKSSDMVTMKKRSIKEKERRRLNPQLCLLTTAQPQQKNEKMNGRHFCSFRCPCTFAGTPRNGFWELNWKEMDQLLIFCYCQTNKISRKTLLQAGSLYFYKLLGLIL